jgi:hypothetical protein
LGLWVLVEIGKQRGRDIDKEVERGRERGREVERWR